LLESNSAALELRRESLCQLLHQAWQDSDGEPCLLACIDTCRDAVDDLAVDDLATTAPETESNVSAIEVMPQSVKPAAVAANGDWTFFPAYPKYGQKAIHFESASADEVNEVVIYSGEPFTDRKSTFQAFMAVVHSFNQVQWAKRRLLENPKVARATHNMVAYRFWDSERSVQRADNDDDGEDGAGNKMASLLDLMGTQDVFVMVTRWFGGIKLGPDRFKHIATATQNVLKDNGFERQNGKNSKTKSGKH